MEMIIQIENEEKANHLLILLKELPYVKIQKISKTSNPKKRTTSKPEDFKKFFGIWAEEKITIEDIRQKAWKRKTK